MAEVIGFIVNMAAVLFLAIEAFRQRERADRLQKLNMEILQNNDDLLGLTEQLTAALGKSNEMVSPACRIIDAMQRLKEKLESGEPIDAKRVTIEQTQDGPLTTVEDVVL